MYGRFAYIWLVVMLNVGKYTIRESYGNEPREGFTLNTYLFDDFSAPRKTYKLHIFFLSKHVTFFRFSYRCSHVFWLMVFFPEAMGSFCESHDRHVKQLLGSRKWWVFIPRGTYHFILIMYPGSQGPFEKIVSPGIVDSKSLLNNVFVFFSKGYLFNGLWTPRV